MKKRKVLFVATVVRLHINMFHQPFIKWFHDQGWLVDVAANNDYENPDDCVIPYCNHFFCLPFERSPFRSGNLEAAVRLKRILDARHYDIIHCHTPMGSVITRLAAGEARRNGTKVIYTVHGFHFYTGAPVINWLVYYPVERILAHRTDLLITMNAEDDANARSFSAGRTAQVHGVGLDLTKYRKASPQERAAVREELGLRKDDFFAVSVAQLIPRKNHMTLIRATALLNNPRFHLFIAGDGAQETELRVAAMRAGVMRQVHFLGFRNDISRLCGSADLFLFASRQEGLPVAVMEAMACGVPIIASRIRGNVDLIEEGKGGFLVNPEDAEGFAAAIRKIIASPAECEAMENYNLEKVKQYGTDEVLKEMAVLYREMM